MDSENTFGEQHETPEKFPTKEEIKSVFKDLLRGIFEEWRHENLRIEEDQDGVQSYRVDILLENGEKIEFNYQKAKYNHKDMAKYPGAQFSASIHVYYYDSNGDAYGGKRVANYLNGQWKHYD